MRLGVGDWKALGRPGRAAGLDFDDRFVRQAVAGACDRPFETRQRHGRHIAQRDRRAAAGPYRIGNLAAKVLHRPDHDRRGDVRDLTGHRFGRLKSIEHGDAATVRDQCQQCGDHFGQVAGEEQHARPLGRTARRDQALHAAGEMPHFGPCPPSTVEPDCGAVFAARENFGRQLLQCHHSAHPELTKTYYIAAESLPRALASSRKLRIMFTCVNEATSLPPSVKTSPCP